MKNPMRLALSKRPQVALFFRPVSVFPHPPNVCPDKAKKLEFSLLMEPAPRNSMLSGWSVRK